MLTLLPGLEADSMRRSVALGALLGLLAYATGPVRHDDRRGPSVMTFARGELRVSSGGSPRR